MSRSNLWLRAAGAGVVRIYAFVATTINPLGCGPPRSNNILPSNTTFRVRRHPLERANYRSTRPILALAPPRNLCSTVSPSSPACLAYTSRLPTLITV